MAITELSIARDTGQSDGPKAGQPRGSLWTCLVSFLLDAPTAWRRGTSLSHRKGGDRSPSITGNGACFSHTVKHTLTPKDGKAGSYVIHVGGSEFWVCFCLLRSGVCVGGDASNNFVSSAPATELGHVTQSFTESSAFYSVKLPRQHQLLMTSCD